MKKCPSFGWYPVPTTRRTILPSRLNQRPRHGHNMLVVRNRCSARTSRTKNPKRTKNSTTPGLIPCTGGCRSRNANGYAKRNDAGPHSASLGLVSLSFYTFQFDQGRIAVRNGNRIVYPQVVAQVRSLDPIGMAPRTYAEGVIFHSPGSPRSGAPWGTDQAKVYAEGVIQIRTRHASAPGATRRPACAARPWVLE